MKFLIDEVSLKAMLLDAVKCDPNSNTEEKIVEDILLEYNSRGALDIPILTTAKTIENAIVSAIDDLNVEVPQFDTTGTAEYTVDAFIMHKQFIRL